MENSPNPSVKPEPSEPNPIVALLMHAVFFSTLAYLGAWITHRTEEFQKQLELWKFWFIPLGLLLGVLTFTWSNFVSKLLEKTLLDDPRTQSDHFVMVHKMMRSRFLFPLVAVPAFGEELFFRGFLQSVLIAGFSACHVAQPVLIGIALPALLYAGAHTDMSGARWTRQHMVQVLILCVPSACWGWAMHGTGSLWPAILAHGVQSFIGGYRGHISLLRYEREIMNSGGNGTDNMPP